MPSSSQVASTYYPPLLFKVTGYRITLLALLTYGAPRAMLTLRGESKAPTLLEMVFGLPIAAVMLCLGFMENDRTPTLNWFLYKDYAEGLCSFLHRFRETGQSGPADSGSIDRVERGETVTIQLDMTANTNARSLSNAAQLRLQSHNCVNVNVKISGSKRRIFALVIGINNYRSSNFQTMRGAVADAKAVEKYLVDDLDIPTDQVVKLHDANATREAIVLAFRSLQRNPQIKRGDAILIYFAGFGTDMEIPTEWSMQQGRIQIILPHDTYTTVDGKQIQPITARTIAELLDGVAEKKGSNITAIFDCCNCGPDVSGTSSIARFSKDKDGLRSYMLITACGAREYAEESDNGGLFTTALLKTLRTVDIGKATYREIMEALGKIPDQNPHCEGFHKDGLIFTPIRYNTSISQWLGRSWGEFLGGRSVER